MNRFRSNIVIETSSSKGGNLSFIEDYFNEIQIGDTKFRNIGPTFRCVIPSVNQTTGAAGFRKNIKEAEPLRSLKRLRSGGVRYGNTISIVRVYL